MKTTTLDGKTFQLSAETAEDFALVDALDMHGMHLLCLGISRSTAPNNAGFKSSGAVLSIDPASPESSRAQAGREMLRAFSQLVRLGLGEAAQHGHVSAPATNPQAQEQLATSLVQLQVVLESLREVVVQQEFVLKEMRSAHGDALNVKTDILANGADGAA